MPDDSLKEFISRLHDVYGSNSTELYGCANPEHEHGIGFKIRGVATLDGSLPNGTYDVQIESDPPGEYIFTDRCNSGEVMKLIERVVAGDWP